MGSPRGQIRRDIGIGRIGIEGGGVVLELATVIPCCRAIHGDGDEVSDPLDVAHMILMILADRGGHFGK